MRKSAMVACFIFPFTLTIPGGQQEPPESRAPKKGDIVLVAGCLRGRTLESTQTTVVNGTGKYDAPLVYRLTGDKGALKKMREEHDGQTVEVTGELKSTLPIGDDKRGVPIGRTGIYVGAGRPHSGSPADFEANRSIPVLAVKSYEGHAVKCTR